MVNRTMYHHQRSVTCVDQSATVKSNVYYEATTNLHMRQKYREIDQLLHVLIMKAKKVVISVITVCIAYGFEKQKCSMCVVLNSSRLLFNSHLALRSHLAVFK